MGNGARPVHGPVLSRRSRKFLSGGFRRTARVACGAPAPAPRTLRYPRSPRTWRLLASHQSFDTSSAFNWPSGVSRRTLRRGELRHIPKHVLMSAVEVIKDGDRRRIAVCRDAADRRGDAGRHQEPHGCRLCRENHHWFSLMRAGGHGHADRPCRCERPGRGLGVREDILGGEPAIEGTRTTYQSRPGPKRGRRHDRRPPR